MLRNVGGFACLVGLALLGCNPGGSSLPEGHTTVFEDTAGKHTTDPALAADANGDPMIAFLDGTSLEFTRWDASANAFTTPVVIADVGGDVTSGGKHAVGLAFDAVTGRLAIDFVRVQKNTNANDSRVVALTLSTDGGKSWSPPVTVSSGAEADLRDTTNAAIAAKGGTIWIAYQQSNYECAIPNRGTCEGMWLLTGDGTSFSPEVAKGSDGIPALADVTAPSLKLDAAGQPGIAFVVDPLSGYTKTVAFWRSGAPIVPVFDSAGAQNDEASASLAFDGTKPRIGAHLFQQVGASYDMLYSESNDGSVWSPPLELPRDATRVTETFQDIAIDANGARAVVADTNGGSGGYACGKLAVVRSSDGTSWSACGADATDQFSGNFDGFVEAYFRADSALAIVSAGNLIDNGPWGIHFWLVK